MDHLCHWRLLAAHTISCEPSGLVLDDTDRHARCDAQ
jgi:hypothetical protein